MFDGAAMVDAAHAAADAAAKALIPAVGFPVVVREADPSKDGGRKEVAFVDTSVDDYQMLEAGIRDGIAIVEIDGGQSGLAQMAVWAQANQGYDAIHVLAHGAEAVQVVGTDQLSIPALGSDVTQAELAEIGHALKAGGDLLLYGCEVGSGTAGQTLLSGIAQATGADVAASTDVTGIDGNWDLERVSGTIDVAGALAGPVTDTWAHDLAYPISIGGADSTYSDQSLNSTVDSNGNLYVVGTFFGTADFDPSTTGTANLTSAGKDDIYLVKYDKNGNYLWANKFGSAVTDTCIGVAVDADNNVYISGFMTGGTVDFNPGAGVANLACGSATNEHGYLAKYDANGNYIWAKLVGDTSAAGRSSTTRVTLDSSGGVIVSGAFYGTVDFDPGVGVATLSTSATNQCDAYVAKYNAADGSYVWAKRFGGTNIDNCQALTVDASGNVYAGISFMSASVDADPGAGTAIITGTGTDYNVAIIKLDSGGNYVWAKSWGGTGTETMYGITVDGSNNVYATGSFQSTVDFDPGAGTTSKTVVGGSDIYVSKFDSSGNFAWVATAGATGSDQGRAVVVDGSGNLYLGGYFNGATLSAGALSLTGLGGDDILVAKLTSSGDWSWLKSAGGTLADRCFALTMNGSNLFLTGQYFGTADLDPGTGTASMIAKGKGDAFALVLDSSGNLATSIGVTAAAPTFTSGTTATFAENGTGTAYAAVATASAGGGAVTYTVGGTDAARFSVNASSGAVTFTASPDYEIPADVGANNVYDVTITATDSNGSKAQNVAITVTDVVEAPSNTAPVLDAAKSPALTPEAKTDTAVPTGVIGTLVSQLIDRSGALSNFSDTQAGDPVGIALTGVDTTTVAGGSWYYTTDGGTWNVVGSVSATSALLLKADANTRLYFVNNGTYTGTMATAVTFRAWDQSTGVAGTKVSTSTNGGTSAFSSNSDTASLTINPTNIAPTFAGAGAATTTATVTAGSSDNVLTSLLTVSDSDTGQVEAWSQYTAPSHGTLSFGSDGLTAASGGTGLSPAAGIKYTPNAGYAGTDTFTVTVSDGQSTITKTIVVTVTPAAPNAPTLESDTGVSGDNKTNATTINFGGTGAAYGTGATDGSDVIVFLDVNGNGSYDAGTDKQAIVSANTSGVWTGAAINATGVADGTYNVYAQTRSTIGSVTGALSAARSITIDHAAPTLSSVTPADNSVNVALNTTTISVAFNESVRAGSGNIVLYDVTAGSAAATIAAGSGNISGWGTSTLTITHGATLIGSHQYALQIAATAVQDDAGNGFAGVATNTTADFTTIDTAPTFTGSGTATLTVNKNATATDITSYLTVGDVDTLQTLTWTQAAAPNNGGTLTFTSATKASGGASLTPTAAAVTYKPNAGFSGTETFTIQVSDGVTTATRQFSVTVNAPAVISATASAGSYTEQAVAAAVDSAITVTDTEGNWTNGTLAVQVSTNSHSADTLALPTSGGGIEFSGGNVYRNGSGGTIIGTTGAASVTGSGTLTITFNASATSADVQAVARAITFANANTDPSSATRTVTFTAADSGGVTAQATRNIAFTLSNDQPTLSATAANPTYVENDATGAQMFSAASISAIEAAQSIKQLTLTVGTLADGSNEVLMIDGTAVALTNGNSVTTSANSYVAAVSVAGNVATVTLTKSGNFTAAAAQTLITGIGYKNTSDDPTTAGGRTVTLTGVQDSGGVAVGSDSRTVSVASAVTITAKDDAPTLTGVGSSPTYNSDTDTPITLFSNISVATIDRSQSVSQIQLTISNLSDGANEILSVDGSTVTLTNGASVASTTGGGGYSVSVSFAGGTATITISKVGGFSAAAAQSLVEGLTYSNFTGTPTANSDRVATLTSITDTGTSGSGNVNSSSLSIASTITVTSPAPVANQVGSITVPVGQTITLAAAQQAITGTSVTDATVGGTVTATVADTTGLLTFTASGVAKITGSGTTSVTIVGSLTDVSNTLGTLKYTPTLTVDGTDTITVDFNDGGNVATLTGGALAATQKTIGVTITANAAPSFAAGNFSDFTVADNVAQNINGLNFTDSNLGGGTAKLTLSAEHGILTLGSLTGLTVAGGANGSASMVLTGSEADLETALGNLTYTATQYYHGTAQISATIDDQQTSLIGGNKTATRTITATINHTDVAPTVTPPGAQTFYDTVAHAIPVTLTDADVGSSTVTVTTSTNNGGILHVDTSGGATITSGGGNDQTSVTFTGTKAQVDAALSGLTYRSTLSNSGAEVVSISTSDNSSFLTKQNGSGTINVTISGNDTPAVTAPAAITVADKSANSVATLAGSAISIADTRNGGTVTVTLTANNSGKLKIDTTGVTMDSTNLNDSSTVTFSGSVAQVNTALATLTYQATYNTLADSTETISVSVNDGYGTGIGAAKTGTGSVTVNLTANDTPVVSTAAAGTPGYATTTQQTITGVTVSDTRSGTVTATVSSTKGNLNFTATNGDGNGATNAAITTNDTNTVIISGTLGDVNATLGTLKYTSTATESGTDTATVSVDDGGANRIGGARSQSQSFTINLTANAAPTLTVPGSTPSYSDNAWHTIATGGIAAVAMADTTIGGTVTATLSDLRGKMRINTTVGTGAVASGNETSTLVVTASNVADLNATLANLQYATDAAATGTETVSVVISDGNGTAIGGAKTIKGSFEVALVGNDVPVVVAPSMAVVVGDNRSYTVSGFSFTDTYAGDTVTATVAAPNGSLTLTAAAGATITNNGGSSVTVTGSVTAVNNTLASFSYQAASEILADKVTVTINDGNAVGVGGAKDGSAAAAINTAPNDTPVLSVPASVSFVNDGSKGISGTVFTDTFIGDTVTAKVTALSGAISASGAGATVTNNGTKSVTITGSVSAVNAALAALTYQPASLGVAGSDTVTVLVDDTNYNGLGGNQTVSKTISVSLTVPPTVAAPPAPPAEAPKEAPKPPPVTPPDTGLRTVVRENGGDGNKGGGFGATQGSAFAGPAVVAAPSTRAEGTASVTIIPATLTAPSATSFQITVAVKAAGAPDALVVNTPVKDSGFVLGARISVTIPADAFASTKPDATVTLTAQRADGAALPGWMVFNPQTGTFEGTPPPGFNGEVVVKVIARDNDGREAVQTFKIQVGEAGQGNVAPQGEGQPQTPGQTGDAGHSIKHAAVKPVGKLALSAQMKAMSFEGRVAKQMALFNAVKHNGKAA